MNQVPEEKKDALTKTLAILGFVVIIILIVWLAVRVVAWMPSAFSSLASIADSVYNGSSTEELEIATESSVVNAGETFSVSWDKQRGEGTYAFSYPCVEGVSIEIQTETGVPKTVDCNTFVDIGDATVLDVTIDAEKQRFTDVQYAITHSQEGFENVTTTSIITIINASIPTDTELADSDMTDQDEMVETMTPEVTTTDNTSTETPHTPSTPTYTAGEPVVTQQFVYQIPVSDPNGDIDLQVTHMGVGIISNETFTPLAELDEDQSGAIRFEIKNIGTRTATNWSYEADLPSDINFDSGNQVALKPNERVVITLGFDGITRTGNERFGVDVTAPGDVDTSNNDYAWSVVVTD